MSGKPVLPRLILQGLREQFSIRTLFFLLVMLLLSAFLLWGMPGFAPDAKDIFPPVSFSVVDKDQSLLSRKLTEQIASLSVVEEVYVESEVDARQRLADGKSLLVLIIPEGLYELSMKSERRPPIEVFLNSRMPVESAVFVRFLNNLAGSIEGVQSYYFAYAAGMRPLFQDDRTYVQAMDRAATHIVFQMLGRKSIVDIDLSGERNTVHFVISALVCLLTMQTSLLLLVQTHQERKSGIRERLRLAGVRWWQSCLARQMVGLALMAIAFIPLIAGLFKLFPDLSRSSLLLSVFSLYWISALLSQAAGTIGSKGDTVLLGAWLCILALMLLGGAIYPEPLLPGVLREIGKYTPVHPVFRTIYHALDGTPASTGTWITLTVMAVVSAALSALSWLLANRAVITGDAS